MKPAANANRGAGVISGICGIADMSFRAGSNGGVRRRSFCRPCLPL
jgi:hypothetical protein